MRLTDPVTLAGRTAASRVVFGPHETNLGQRRALSPRHVAYYLRRAQGGAGVIVTETASVHPSDWPYERAPLAAECREGWRRIAAACQPAGALVLAGLGHTGLQGSSAYSQAALWAPSRFTDPITRETPMVMEQPEIDALVAGFAAAAATAVAAGLDGVEIDAGPGALLRQFHSGLTNSRSDGYGTGALALTMAVLAAVRSAIGAGHVLALRLSCDELAPWAGVTQQIATTQAVTLAPALDLLTVVRGGPYSASAYRPDGHTPPMFNTELARAVRAAVDGAVPVVLQGSVVDPAAAQAALDDGAADLAEMTRAQLADAGLVGKLRAGLADRIRPCLLCNQACRVRDSRNPLVSCVADPRTGHETQDPPEPGETAAGRGEPGETAPGQREPTPGQRGPAPAETVLVVGGGPAGLEAARTAALAGHRVRLAERGSRLAATLRAAAVPPGRERLALLAAWLESECRRLGVTLSTGTEITAADLDDARARGVRVVLATGSRPVPRFQPGVTVDALAALSGAPLPAGPAVVYDPAGGPAGVGVAEWLAAAGRTVAIVTQDQVVGSQLSLTGDLADASTRLQRAGVARETRALLRDVSGGTALLEDAWTGELRRIGCAVVIDCGHRLPDEELYAQRPGTPRAGDCVAPRTIGEAIREGRRRAAELSSPR
jgi:2,4-dienoyl-CoA reductase-like NADH-dependent reductase (Old Yellow Enzyme family)